MMQELSCAQAEMLKGLRKKVSNLAALAEIVWNELVDGCQHDPPDEESCYLCALSSIATEIEPIAGRLAICLDSALEGKEFPE